MGRTPRLWHSYTRDKISAISSVTVSPRRQRVGLYAQFYPCNIKGEQVVRFLRHLLRYLRGNVELVWDGGTIHRKDVVKQFLASQRRLHVHRFPGYAPQLNPDEFVWTKAKHDLSNGVPKDVLELGTTLRRSIRRIKNSQRLLWSCIDHSELPWR